MPLPMNPAEQNQARTPLLRSALKIQRVELAVFLLLIMPAMATSFLAVRQIGRDLSFVPVAVATMLHDLTLVSLILFFLWRNGESIRSIGWTERGMRTEFLLGLLFFLPFTTGSGIVQALLTRLGFSHAASPVISALRPESTVQFLVAILLVIVVAISEETIFRGYLMLRATAVHPGKLFGVVFSSVIFALGHGYEGWSGVITIAISGAALAWLYLWRGSLVAPVTIHLLQDLTTLVVVPVLGKR